MRRKTNSALFSSTIGVFSRSIQETEWRNIKIKLYIIDSYPIKATVLKIFSQE